MGIPTTKASTDNVDAGADRISLARPDIKQNIDNVNEIIDHLTDSVTQKVASFRRSLINSNVQNVSGSTYRVPLQIVDDDDSLITYTTDAYTFDLAAGKYHVTVNDYSQSSPTSGPNYEIINETDTLTFADIEQEAIQGAPARGHFFRFSKVVTIAATKTMSLRLTGDSTQGSNALITVRKIG